jgi:hypothetical protein
MSEPLTLRKLEGLTTEWPTGLKPCAEAARELAIPEERLSILADGGFAPHFRIDGGPPMFKIGELKRWAGVNLVEKANGRAIPEPVRIVLQADRVKDFRDVPECIREIVGLCDITGEVARTGIYFLCFKSELHYIGQSVNAASRIKSHIQRHQFDRVYFLPWPGDDLNRLEGALIRILQPRGNGRSVHGRMSCPNGDPAFDADVVEMIKGRAP